MSGEKLRIYLFSFNRPRFLKNCVASIEALAGAYPLTIVDDHSDDKKTRRLLARFCERHQVLRPDTADTQGTFKTGGLYPNKNLALAHAERHNVRYALYMHDDQQLVRQLTEADITRFDRYFGHYPDHFELHGCFMKARLRPWDEQYMRPDNSGLAYFRDADKARGHKHFSGSGLFHVARTRATLGEFAIGEKPNEAALAAAHIKLGFYAWPFMTWLPFPISYRGKKRSVEHAMVEHLGGGGFHPIRHMTGAEEQALLERNLEILPIAEDFLHAPSAPKARYWSTMGGFYNASARGGFRKSLARLLHKRQLRHG